MRKLLPLILFACSEAATVSSEQTTHSVQNRVVYGTDDRLDVYAHPDAVLQQRARTSAVALMAPRDLDMTDPNNVTLHSDTLAKSENLCSDQRFQNDPTSAFCSGTLIAEDLVLTAGHCITSQSACDNTVFVFDYLYNEPGKISLSKDSVYQCKTLLTRKQEGSGADFAVLRIDRKAEGRIPAPLHTSDTALDAAAGVAVIGCGSGIPLKIDSGGQVRDPRAAKRDFFVASTDTFGGNSGSGVYSLADHALVGILVRGERDYTSSNGCTVVNVCEEAGCRGEDSTYVYNAVKALCSVGVALPGVVCPAIVAQGSITFESNSSAPTEVLLEEGQTLAFGTCTLPGTSGDGDSIIQVLGPDGVLVAENDDSCGSLSYLELTAPVAGKYTLNVGCYNGGACSGTAVWQVQ